MAEQVKGHLFDFDTEKCKRCGMTRTQFEDRGEPPCTGHPEPADDEPGQDHRFARPDR